ncbi:unnamed protein product [Clonostachys byssicola]|uniref:Uncharacterized protein n=1 Tax=Clonostachys byssicola TaxID=160290 RepID=A0A9N9XYF2_9HYPO|nr:unnamed protein product [Clonostachys byssicola]
MAQPPLFGVPGFVHYWEPITATYSDVVKLASFGPNSPREDAVRHTWDDMLHHYFPGSGLPFKWKQKPSRGVEKRVSSKRLDIIAVKVAMSGTMSGLPPGPSGILALDIERDYLWVGYREPNRDVPFEWKDALLQTGRRLHVAHPNRDLFVIIGVGLKYLKLYWNGSASVVDAPSCTVLKDGAGEWPLDPRFRMPPGLIAGTPYLNQATGQIDTTKALSLDFWTAGGPEGLEKYGQSPG